MAALLPALLGPCPGLGRLLLLPVLFKAKVGLCCGFWWWYWRPFVIEGLTGRGCGGPAKNNNSYLSFKMSLLGASLHHHLLPKQQQKNILLLTKSGNLLIPF